MFLETLSVFLMTFHHCFRSRAAVTASCIRLSMMSNCNGGDLLSSSSSPYQSGGNNGQSHGHTHGHSHNGHGGNSSRNNSLAKNSQSNRVDFASVLKKWNAPIPPALLRKLGRGSESPLGKVRVIGQSFLSFSFSFLL